MECGDCGATLRKMDGYYECPKCGWTITDDEMEDFDIDEYRSENAHFTYTSDIPEGCLACGGDYPECTSSCPMFD